MQKNDASEVANPDVTTPTTVAPIARAGTRSKTGIPDWAPVAVIGTLVAVGVLGGTLAVRSPAAPKVAAAASSAPAAPLPAFLATAAASGKRAVDGADTIRVSHIVVAYERSPFARQKGITRTVAEAMQRAEDARGRALKGEDFATLVAEYSDDPRSVETKGDLGKLQYSDAVRDFADLAFALKPGEISRVHRSPNGYHVVKRTE
jgi:hypothetical protein